MIRAAQLLAVRPGEGRLAAVLVGLMLVTSAGGSIGGNATEALFYARFGVEFLPYMYVALGFTTIAMTFVVTALIGRFARERLYVALPAVIAVALAVERAAFSLELPILYPIAWLLMNIMGSLQGLFTWGLAGIACDTRQAKRLFPLFAAGGIFGAVLGGFGTSMLAGALGALNLLLVWALASVIAVALGRALVGKRAPTRPARRRTRLVDDLLLGLRTVRRSELMGWMSVAVILFAILFFSLAFPFSKAATAEFPDADALAGFLGLFQGASTGAAFLASLFLANRLFARAGIMAAILSFTLIYLAGFGALALVATFPVLVAFRFAQMTWLMGVAGSAYQAMFNVVPPDRRDQTRAFLDGVPGQAGTVIAGVLLVVGTTALRESALYLIGLFAAGAATFLVWRATRAYGRALVAALRVGMPQLFFAEEEPFGGFRRDAAAVAVALAGARDPDLATRRVAAEVLGHVGTPEAAAALVDALSDADAEVRVAAVRGLARSDLAVDPAPLERRLEDDDPRVRAAAAAAILHRGPHTRAAAAIDALLSEPVAETRALALDAFAAVGDAARFDAALACLADASPRVRRAAAAAVARLDPARAVAALVSLLGDPDRAVVDAAADALGRVGAPAFDAVLRALEEPGTQEGALQVLERLPSPPDPAPIRGYARGEATRAVGYHELAARASANVGEGHALLAYSLARRAREHALRSLRALGLLGDRDSAALALRSLASRDALQRANAAETLEATASDRELVKSLLPIWEPLPARPAGDGWLQAVARDPDPWLQECAAFVAANGGRAPMQTLTTLSQMERILFLRRVPLFADLPPADLKQLAAIAEEQVHPDGDVICEQGEPGDELYVIVSGEVRVESRGNEIARRRPGEFVGEVALITGAPRNATLVAGGETRLLRIERRQFEGLLRERPDAGLAVMRVLAERLTERT